MSKKKVYLSIDAHARHCTLGAMDARGKFQRTWTFRTCESELIRHVKGIDAGKKIIAIEEGPLAFWIAQTIRPYVQDIVIADAREIPLVSRNARKRDKVDVRNLCRLLRLGELRRVYHPEDDERAIFKAAVQQYIDLRMEESRLKHKIKAKYRGWGVHDVEGTSVYNPLKKASYLKQVSSQPVRNQLERLYTMLGTALAMQSQSLLEAESLGRKYPELVEFQKIPGVGPIGALTFDAYIQTPDRFTRKQTLWRYCKLGVTDRSSDDKPLGFKRLDKAGNSELKAMSYRAFLGAMRVKRENEVRNFYEASLKRTHSAMKARLNTQRKILSVMHGIWRKREGYRSELFLGSE